MKLAYLIYRAQTLKKPYNKATEVTDSLFNIAMSERSSSTPYPYSVTTALVTTVEEKSKILADTVPIFSS
jgi:hypothetical protein